MPVLMLKVAVTRLISRPCLWKLSAKHCCMQMIQHILFKHKYIETFLESSARKQQSVPDIFYYAVKSVVHPAEPLVEFESGQLKPLCVKALKRIFLICDMDTVRVCSSAACCQLACTSMTRQAVLASHHTAWYLFGVVPACVHQHSLGMNAGPVSQARCFGSGSHAALLSMA